MKSAMLRILFVAVLVFISSGCGHESPQGEADHSHNADGSHADSAQSFSGATHKEGTGITLLDETRKLLGIQTAEVEERALPRTVRFAARVFGASTEGNQRVLGTVSTNAAVFLRSGLSVEFKAASGLILTGVVQQVSLPLHHAEAEVVSVVHAAPPLKAGEFGEMTISVSGAKDVLVVPRAALIKGTSGDLVYAVNGDAYTLTWVKTGAEANGFIEIQEGLFAGDSVVTQGAMDLWLVELRAVKGGQGCCPAPPKKGKS